MNSVVQMHLDSEARKYGFDGVENAISYADEAVVPKFQAQGLAFRAWRSLVRQTFQELLEEMKTGKRDILSDDDLVELLPAFELPE